MIGYIILTRLLWKRYFTKKKFFIKNFGPWVVFLVQGMVLQHQTSTGLLNITVEESCHQRKINYLNCWTFLPATVNELCQQFLSNCTSDCWIIMQPTLEKSYQLLFNSRANSCGTMMLMIVEQSCHQLLNYRASDCWKIVSSTVEQSCKWLLKTCTSSCWKIVRPTVEQSYQ